MEKKYKIILLICIVLVILRGFAEPFRISGDCMEPAVKDGQMYFVNRVSPYIRTFKLNDIVIFDYEDRAWVSRIVALENDTIQIEEGRIIVNGIALNDRGVERDWNKWKYGSYAINQPLRVPEGHVYVLSDKLSAHHDDSRVFGPIPQRSILGVLW